MLRLPKYMRQLFAEFRIVCMFICKSPFLYVAEYLMAQAMVSCTHYKVYSIAKGYAFSFIYSAHLDENPCSFESTSIIAIHENIDNEKQPSS